MYSIYVLYRTGWPAIRDGEYGGPLLLYDETKYVMVSSLSHFMASNMKVGHEKKIKYMSK